MKSKKKAVINFKSVVTFSCGNKFTVEQVAHLAGLKPQTVLSRVKLGYQPGDIMRPANRLHIPSATNELTSTL